MSGKHKHATLRNAPQSVRDSPYGVKILRLASLAHPEANANCFIAEWCKNAESCVFSAGRPNFVKTWQVETKERARMNVRLAGAGSR